MLACIALRLFDVRPSTPSGLTLKKAESGLPPMEPLPTPASLEPMSASVLIVDDHSAFRTAARRMLEQSGFRVVGEAEDAGSALEAIRILRPEIVLLDVQLPDMDGIEVCRRLAAEGDMPVIVLTSIREKEIYGSRLEAAPARGFISKLDLSGSALAALLAQPA